MDLLAVALVVSAVWVPMPSDLAGSIFEGDRFFHWDHFVMAPALAWRHGFALGIDAFSQYGAGWPIVVNVLSPWVPLSHQNAIHMGVLYTCVVYAGLYGLLVVLTGGRLLALAGTALALRFSLFSPFIAEAKAATIWQWPSLTVLRAPMTVWFLLALLLHARTRHRGWLMAGAALVGLGLFLETDTGVFLAATLGVYGLCRTLAGWLDGGDPEGFRPSRATVTFAAGVATMLTVLAAGLLASTRGMILSDPGGFLAGWVRGLGDSASQGLLARTFAWFVGHHDAGTIARSLAIIGAGLAAVCATMARLLHGRLDPTSLFAGCVGFLVVMRSSLFVWRTLPPRMTDPAIPLAVLAVLLLAALGRPADRWLRVALGRPRTRLDHVLPLAALAVSVALVVDSAAFRDYPNAWHLARHGRPERGVVLLPERGEVTGIRPRAEPDVRALQAAIAEVRRRGAQGERVAVVAKEKTLIFLEADVRPWRGSASWYLNTATSEQVASLVDSLGAEGPDTVLIAAPKLARDVWRTIRSALPRHYRLAGRVGFLEVWERRR